MCRCSTLPPALAPSAQAAVTHGSFTAGVAAVRSQGCVYAYVAAHRSLKAR